jgi:hypothetical protein
MKLTTAVIAVGVLAALPARAQVVAQSNGGGTLTQAGRSDALRGARLEMGPNSDATVQVTGTNLPSYSFGGRWVAGGTDSVRLTLASGFGDPTATGSGSATIRAGQVITLQLSGATRGGRFTVSYQGSPTPDPTPTPNANPSGFSLDQNLVAAGEIRGGKGATRVERAHVILRQDGMAQITLRGPQTSTLTGTWKDGGRDTYTVDVVSGFGSDKTRATVNVYLMRSQLFSVEGKGTSPGQGGDFTLKVGGR